VFSVGGFNLMRPYLRDAYLFPCATKSGGNFLVRNRSNKWPVQIYLTQGPWNALYWGRVISQGLERQEDLIPDSDCH